VTSSGRVYSIDFGESSIIETFLVSADDWKKPWSKEIEKNIQLSMEFRYRQYLGQMQKRPIIKAIDQQITYKDMEVVIERVKSLTKDDIEELLKGIYKEGSAEWNNSLNTIMTRKDALENFLQKLPKLSQIGGFKNTWYSDLVDRNRCWPGQQDNQMRCAA
jgi:hypothetical protein